MELVYLWVEEYKNIKNQGFNFSPRYECEFDGENLTIEDKYKDKDYMSIFPDNINITAIVGENGSGKSSLAQILAYYNRGDFSKLNNSFLIFLRNDKFYSLNTNNLSSNVEIKSSTRSPFFSYFANEITTFLNGSYPLSLKNYDRFDAMKDNQKQNMMPNNKYLSIYKEKILEIELFNNRFEKILIENQNLFQLINQKFIFDNKKREIHFYEIGASLGGEDDPINKIFKESPYTGNTLFDDKVLEDTSHQTYFYKYLILNRLMFIDERMGVDLKTLIEDIKKIFQKEIFEDKDYSQIINEIHKVNPIDDDKYKIDNVQKILENFEYKNNNIWVEKNSTNISQAYSFNNSLLNTIDNYNTIRTNYFHNNNEEYNYLSLSSGEREYIKLFTHIIYHLQQDDRRDIFFLDEPDLALHPNWQKKLIKDLVHFTEKKSIQLILTSHSPFILSDIPKEHVIFLQDFKQKEPFKDKQTFGANIHTLLSDGFFMSDGLMGEFAKGKIKDIKNFYEKVKKDDNPKQNHSDEYEENEKDFKHIQSIIGEPFLQTITKNYLDELHLIFSDDEILIDKELEELEARQKYLKSLKR
jgi:predicted ATPase